MHDAPIAAASSARPGLTTLSRTFPRSESCVGPPSAASSTNTSEPHRNPGQHQWPSSGTPQALLDATRNRPARSARYREFLQPQGYGDELRAVLRTGTSVWGTLSLFRDQYAAPFTSQEAAFVASVSAPLASHSRPASSPKARRGALSPAALAC